jgi:hypothetical protein
VTDAETNLINMVNLMLDKRNTGNTSSTAIDTAEVSVRVVKSKGKHLPVNYEGRDAGFALPFSETFQDRQRKKNVSINVRALCLCSLYFNLYVCTIQHYVIMFVY